MKYRFSFPQFVLSPLQSGFTVDFKPNQIVSKFYSGRYRNRLVTSGAPVQIAAKFLIGSNVQSDYVSSLTDRFGRTVEVCRWDEADKVYRFNQLRYLDTFGILSPFTTTWNSTLHFLPDDCGQLVYQGLTGEMSKTLKMRTPQGDWWNVSMKLTCLWCSPLLNAFSGVKEFPSGIYPLQQSFSVSEKPVAAQGGLYREVQNSADCRDISLKFLLSSADYLKLIGWYINDLGEGTLPFAFDFSSLIALPKQCGVLTGMSAALHHRDAQDVWWNVTMKIHSEDYL